MVTLSGCGVSPSASGYRNSTSGAFNNTGDRTLMWSVAITGNNSYYLNVTNTVVQPINNTNRANGFVVRCVQHLLPQGGASTILYRWVKAVFIFR